MTTTKRKSWPLKASQLLPIHSINQLRNHSHNHISITCNTQQGKNSIHIFWGGGLGSIKQEARYGRFTVSLHQRKLLSVNNHACMSVLHYVHTQSSLWYCHTTLHPSDGERAGTQDAYNMSHNLYNSTKTQKQALHSLLTGSTFGEQDSKFG